MIRKQECKVIYSGLVVNSRIYVDNIPDQEM